MILVESRRVTKAAITAMAAETPERWVSVDELAEHLGLRKETVYRWIESRGLPAHRVGRLWKFKLSEIDTWVRSGEAARDGDTDE